MRASTENGAPRSARSRAILTVALALLVALIGALDYWSGNEIALTIFYLIPIALGAWYVGPRAGNLLALLSAGAWLLADVYGGPIYDSPIIPPWNAAVTGAFFLITSYALSARKRSERRLLELMDIKSELTSMVSHELRTPMACIKEGIDIVADGTSGPLNPAQRTHLQTAKRNVDRLARLLDQVLTFQKLEARRLDLLIEITDINQLVQQAAEGFELPARKKGVRVLLNLAPGLPFVACDPDRISQVLSNLLSNALKFTEQGQICVRTEPRGNAVRVLVDDQGPGIPSEDLERVFRDFTQLPSESGRSGEGTGLGLAIAQQIVELHGGRIDVESQPGCGSTFHFTLPVHEQAPAARFVAALHERRV
jgi:signal transduction histidine kinase